MSPQPSGRISLPTDHTASWWAVYHMHLTSSFPKPMGGIHSAPSPQVVASGVCSLWLCSHVLCLGDCCGL